MRRQRKAKIVATLGPSSSSKDVIADLFAAGVDVFRLNFSHGAHDDHAARVQMIRDLEASSGRPIGIMMDIQGPKLRIGAVRDGSAVLHKNQSFRLDLNSDPGDADRVSLPHPEIFEPLSSGDHLMIDDGRIRLRVINRSETHADTTVEVGGPISSNKGVNVPGVLLPISVITDKDRRDVEFGLSCGVDWVAQSFVQRAQDVVELRALVGDRARIVVKLEKPSALDDLEGILQHADGIMVARGDLGVELPPQRVPVEQKRIIRACRQAGKPVIIATHMLDSMVQAPVPTRAEASDVATAIYDGVDAVMLSAESAAGEYPVDSVKIMNRIIEEVEHDPIYANFLDAQRPEPDSTTADAICNALQRVTHILASTTTVTYTASGSTSLRAARERPQAPILSLTPKVETARYLSLAWGVHGVVVDVANENAAVSDVIEAAKSIAVRERFANSGEAVIIAAGMPFGTAGSTNLLHIAWID
ncbi:MAG: pyruvate kinase [Pseudomonadota bacterium]